MNSPFDARVQVADTRPGLTAERGSRAARVDSIAQRGGIARLTACGSSESRDEPLRSTSLDDALDQMSAARPIRSVNTAAYAYGSSHPLQALDIVFEDGGQLAVLHKCSVRSNEGSIVIAPDFIRDAGREAMALTSIPGLQETGVPRLYAIITAADGEISLLFERATGAELYQFGSIRAWTAAAEWLAAFHVRHATSLPDCTDRLLSRDREYFEQWWPRAITFAGHHDPAAADRLRRIEPRWRRTVDRLATAPVALVHGEFYPSNIMIENTGSGLRVRPIDWEMSGPGPLLLDLAALTGGHWDAQRRDAVVNTYRFAFQDAARRIASHARLPHDFDRALDDCRLALDLQWLGWSADWTPPAEHRFDWLSEAETIASRPD